MFSYPPSLRYGLHPFWPERLGYRHLLRLTNPRLAQLLRQTDGYTLVSGRNRTTLYREALSVLENGIAGDFAEIGVHRGGSAAVLAEVLKREPTRHLHLFDRWGDLPEPTDEDGIKKVEYGRANIPDKLAKLRSDPPLIAARHVLEHEVEMPADRLHYYQGWYHDSFDTFGQEKLAFVSMDCDYYESTKTAFGFLDSRMVAGGVIVIDDYGSWPGSRKATDEFVAQYPDRFELVPMATGPAVLRFR